MIYLKANCLFFSFLIALSSISQTHIFKNFNIENGLPSNETYKVLHDSRGYIWLATDRGICKFNGRNFRNYTVKDGLPNNDVIGIYEDKEGRIWSWSISGEFAYFHKGKIVKLTNINLEIKKIFKAGVVNGIAIDSFDTIHIGSFNSNIKLKIAFDKKLKKYILIKTKSKEQGIYINIINDKEVLLFHDNRTIDYGKNKHYKTQHFIFTNKNFKPSKLIGEISYPNIRVIQLLNKTILISIQNKLYVLKPSGSLILLKKYDGVIINIKQDDIGNLWVSLYKKGCFFYKNAFVNIKNERILFPGLSISSLDIDRNCGYWFSTLEKGLIFIPELNITHFNKSNGLINNNINNVEIGKKNELFAGTKDGYFIIIKNNSIVNLKLPELNQKYSLNNILSLDSCVYLCANGLFKYDLKSSSIKLISNNSTYCAVKIDDKVLIGGYEYLIEIGRNKIKFKDVEFKINSICNNGKKIFLGEAKGLWSLNKNKLDFLGLKNKILNDKINDLEFKKGQLYVATENNGLIILNNQKQIKINKINGIISNLCKSILVYKNHIFIATNKGLSEIILKDKSDFSKYSIRNYTVLNGLISNDVNDVKIYKNKLAIATSKGITLMNIKPLNKINVSPPIYFTSLIINDKSRQLKDTFNLKYNENNLSFNFNGLVYNLFNEVIYRYRLIGLSSNWKITKNNNIYFTTLPVGEYLLEVQVKNNDGNWGSNSAKIKIYIHPPFWNNWIFRVLTLSFILFVIYIITKKRINVIKNREKEKRKMIKHTALIEKEKAQLYTKSLEMEIKFLSSQMNPHFTFNAMNSIQYFMLNNEPMKAQNYLSKYSKLIRLVLENNMQKFALLEDELYLMKLYLEIESMRFDKNFDYKIEISDSLNRKEVMIPPMILQPYIENAIWHGIFHEEIKEAKLSIKFEKFNEFILCIIKDNGIGREKSKKFKNDDNKHKSFGLLITQKRLKYLHEDSDLNINVKISDILDDCNNVIGTKVEVLIPLIYID